MGNIYLIGYRCTGKSGVGKALAAAIDWPFIDSDDEVIRHEGMTINMMVETYGWPYFRKAEHRMIKQLSTLGKHVVATGGGVILDDDNVSIMKQTGFVVWLKASPETVKHRMITDARSEELRPALTSKGLTEEINETLMIRNPLYQRAGDVVVDTDHISVQEARNMVIGKLREMGAL